jgi:hypothetical protein
MPAKGGATVTNMDHVEARNGYHHMWNSAVDVMHLGILAFDLQGNIQPQVFRIAHVQRN